MIIFGSRGVTSFVESGEFNCPQCATPRTYSLRQVRNFFTLYFIPLIPLDISGRYVECTSCGGTFSEETKDYDPAQAQQETNTQLLRVMIMAALADGMVDEAERAEIEKQYLEFAGLPVAPETLNQEISLASSSQADLNKYVGSIAHELSPHGKALVVKLAYDTMSAAGELQPGHRDQLTKLADTLQIPQDQYMELIRQFSEPQAENQA